MDKREYNKEKEREREREVFKDVMVLVETSGLEMPGTDVFASVSSSMIQNVDTSMGMKKDAVSRHHHSFDGKTDQQQMPGRRSFFNKNTSSSWMKDKGVSAVVGASAVPWLLAGYGGGGQARAVPLWKLGRSGRIRGGWGNQSDGKPRIMILMSDTGGGHRASAEALRGGFEHLYGSKYRIDIVDLWTHHTPWPYNEFPKSYSFMVKYPFIWRGNFTFTQPKFVHVPLSTAMHVVTGSRISAAFDEYRPNLIISVHPLMQHVPVKVLRRRIESGLQDPNTAFATVVTDLTTCHNTWFYNDVDRCFVATEESKKQALKLGMPEDKLRVYGLPIRPAFSQGLPRAKALRKKLGLDLSKPCILLMGGGEGMGPVEKTVDAVAEQIGAEAQLVVVCGRNATLVNTLQSKYVVLQISCMMNASLNYIV